MNSQSLDSDTVIEAGSFISLPGELLSVGDETSVLASGETESLQSLSCGHSFITCLRILASARDPELDSVRPAFNTVQQSIY